MTTTFEKFRQPGMYAANYSTLPTQDVEILNTVHVCAFVDPDGKPCESPVIYDKGSGYFGNWVHVVNAGEHFISVRTTCRYCGTNDPKEVKGVQHAWYDAVECSRCGGVSGYAIGD